MSSVIFASIEPCYNEAMFFHTHVYFAEQKEDHLDPLTVIGSIIPDLALTSIISWDDLHKKKGIFDFFSTVSDNFPESKSLLTGIHYHNTLDYYTHIKYQNDTGYAYKMPTLELINLVSQACGIDEKIAKGISHNFIESAVEMHIIEQSPEIHDLIKGSIENVDVKQLAHIFSTHYKKSENEFYDNLQLYFSLILKYDLTEINEWVFLWDEFAQLLLKKSVDKNTVKQALVLSQQLIQTNWKDFLESYLESKNLEIVDSNL